MLFAVNAAAETKNGTIPGTSIDWTYETGTYTLTLSGSGTLPDYTEYTVDNHYFRTDENALIATYNIPEIGELKYYIIDLVKHINIGSGINTIGTLYFSEASKLETLTLSENVTAIKEKAFYRCTSLNTIYGSINDDIEVASDAFLGCNFVKNNNGILVMGNTLVDADPTFKEENITIPETVTKIKSEAFKDYISLQKITIKGNLTSIGDRAFANCSALNDINIPSTVTTWGKDIFSGCIYLPNDGTYQKAGDHVIVKVYDKTRKKYTISSDITYIEPGIFDNSCINIKYLIYEGTSAPKITNGSPIITDVVNKIESTVVPSGKESLYSAAHGPNINTTKVNINTNKYTSYTFLHDVVVPDYVGVYVAESSDGEFVELKRVNKVNDKFKIQAGQGVFLRAQENKLYTFESTKGQATNNLGTNLIKGVTEDKEFIGTENAYILQTIDGKQKLYEILEPYSLPMCKAYLDGSTLANVKSFSLRESNDDETAITETTQDTSKAREYIYNLSGQKLSTMQEGLNIVNGKIVIN